MKLLPVRDWPVRMKVLAVLCIICTLPYLLTLYVVKRGFDLDLMRNAQSLLVARSEIFRERLDELHQRNSQELERLTRKKALIQLASEYPAAPRHLLQEVEISLQNETATYKEMFRHDLLGIAVIDPSGQIISKTDDILEDRIDLHRFLNQYLKDAFQEQEGKGREGKIKISDLYFAPEAGNKAAVAYAQPVKNKDGKVVFLVVFWVDAEAFWNILTDFHNEYGHSFGYLTLFDQHGIRIGHSLKDDMLYFPAGDVPAPILRSMIDEQRFGPETTRLTEKKFFSAQFARATEAKPDDEIFEGFSQANKQLNVGTCKRLRSVKWTVFCMVPKKKLDVFVTGLSFFQIGILLAIVLFGPVAGVWWIAGMILKPVRTLSQTIQKFGAGEFASRVPITSNDELGTMAAGFNAMADQLQLTVRNLHRALTAQAASEARLRAIMQTVGDGILTITRDGIIDSFNHGASAILGYQPEEVIGKNVWMLITPPDGVLEDKSLGSKLDTQLLVSLTLQREVEAKHKDGHLVPVDLSIGTVRIGDVGLFTLSFHDLTTRKRAEGDIHRARDAAELANRAKSQFLAAMSHELRSPLTAILGYTEILQEEVDELGQQSMRADLEKIHAQSMHLLTLINDLLDMSKIEAGKMELYLESFDLARLIPDVANIVQPLMTTNANRLEMHVGEGLGTMYGDVTRLRQCLFNLLSNAAKFTDHGVVTLTVTRDTSAGEDWVNFQVRDTGIGMTREQIQRIFFPFAQGDVSTTRKYGGTGLGLTITRKLCRIMGGDISLASIPGQGSTFTMRLPAVVSKPPVESMAAPVPATEPQPGKDTVLVVDDDPAVLDMLTRFLTKEGFYVATAANGEDCLALARKIHPRAITLDVMIPGMDGWSILSALKADPQLADIPVIILSIVEDKNLGFGLGAADYLVKPLDRVRLLEILRKRCSSTSSLALAAADDPP